MSFPLRLWGFASRLSKPTLTAPLRPAIAPARYPSTTPNRSLSMTRILPAKAASSKAGKGGSSGKKNAPFPTKASKPKKAARGRVAEQDPKIINMLRTFASLSPKRLPPPLRMARNRHLRHWTIHRGWLMFRRRQREARERTLMRQYQSMHAACEALRLTDGPGTRPEGYLYRVAMEKKGVYGLRGVPIEYARAQVDTPPKKAWDHEWKASE